MGRIAFPGGVHPKPQRGGVQATGGLGVRQANAPAQVAILLDQSAGQPCQALVKPGDAVKLGQKIGEPQDIGAPVHASVSGKVLDIRLCANASGTQAQAVVIENDFRGDWVELQPRGRRKSKTERI